MRWVQYEIDAVSDRLSTQWAGSRNSASKLQLEINVILAVSKLISELSRRTTWNATCRTR